MSNRIDKPMRSPTDLVTMLRDEKGITFTLMNESDAAAYLAERNNYLRTASYRKNYDKHSTGSNEGKYIQLDFEYLVELSKLDMYLRQYLLPMCIDIEHALKIAIISDIEANPAEDGYAIVEEFLTENTSILSSIAQKADSIFTGDLIEKYFDLCYVFDASGSFRTEIIKTDCPVWVLVELLAFKDCLSFIRFYMDKYPGRLNNINLKHMNTIRSLRNACAHNNCLLVSLRPGTTKPAYTVSQAVARIPTVQKEERKNKLSCRPIFETVCLLIEYQKMVSTDLCQSRMADLKAFAHGRLVKNSAYFASNQIVSTGIAFLQKIVDNYA